MTTKLFRPGRPKTDNPLTPAQKQKAYRERQKTKSVINHDLFVPRRLLDQALASHCNNQLSALGVLSDREVEHINRLVRDLRQPRQSLDGLYQDVVRECNRKSVNDETMVNIETLYLFATKPI